MQLLCLAWRTRALAGRGSNKNILFFLKGEKIFSTCGEALAKEPYCVRRGLFRAYACVKQKGSKVLGEYGIRPSESYNRFLFWHGFDSELRTSASSDRLNGDLHLYECYNLTQAL
jgi:hypothetical protein